MTDTAVSSPEAVRRAVTAYFAATRAMDVDAWLATLDEEARSFNPVGTPPTVGHPAHRQFFEGIVSAFETLGLTEDFVSVCASQAAVKWTGRGKTKHGRNVRFDGIDVFEVNARGRIQQVLAYWDPATLMREIQS